MLENIQLLRNVGQFDSVNGMPSALTKLTVIYAENGRGKTTLASILHSISRNDPTLIEERRRLAAQPPPHKVLRDGQGTALFQTGVWSRAMPEVIVFDDRFVSENVCSGIELETVHRQHLHELILGAQGVSLNTALQNEVAAVETHNRRLKALPDAIPATIRGRLGVDAFCALEARADIDQAIEERERGLAAAKSADAVRNRALFQPINVPAFDLPAIDALLGRSLPDLEAEALARVQAHLGAIGKDGEGWVADGMARVTGRAGDLCPFCAQDISGSPLIAHYRAYFSDAYADLRRAIVELGQGVAKLHGGDAEAAFERAVLVATQAHEFWSTFTGLPPVLIDTLEMARSWTAAREGVLTVLRAKHASPLDRLTLPGEVRDAVATFDRQREKVALAVGHLLESNQAIELLKEQTATANVATLEADLASLRTVKARHSPDIDVACRAYLDEKEAKVATERRRDEARTALDQYRDVIFPSYQLAINEYLRLLGASFRLDKIASVNNRGGSTCNYSVLINDQPVSITAAQGPSFRNTLSAGDRNTLALAFFFASLEQDATGLVSKIVVIDDPMTSLDEHRNRNTLHQIRRLVTRVDQVIVLSHSKPFLCPLWEGTAVALRSAFRIDRVRVGHNEDASTIGLWDVHADCISENDRRHEQLQAYLVNADPATERDVAESLRPILEAFMRVAYPLVFSPGTLFGSFLSICEQRKGTPAEVLASADITELRNLLDYANDFHHDGNPAYQTMLINGQELTDFCRRTIAFARRG